MRTDSGTDPCGRMCLSRRHDQRHAGADAVADEHAKRDADDHADEHGHPDADQHADAYPDSFANSDPDRHAN
ncbi:hypothetical protein D3C84_1304480 [compost metagenome]